MHQMSLGQNAGTFFVVPQPIGAKEYTNERFPK